VIRASTQDNDNFRLLERARNVNSQFGEDGIIAALLSQIPSRTSWCVEFGAWDGKHLSNTRKLIDDEHYLTYRKSPIEHPTPGGETIREVQARGVAAVMRTIDQHPGKRVIFVSHGDIVRTVLCHFLKVELQHFHRIRVDNAALSAIQIAGEFAEVKFLNLMPNPQQAFVAPFSTARSEVKRDDHK